MIEDRDGSVRVRIRAQPRASRTEVVGEFDGAIRVRIAAPPVEGEANAELIRYLAKRLGVARSRVRVIGGDSSRTKTVEIAGIDAVTAWRALLG